MIALSVHPDGRAFTILAAISCFSPLRSCFYMSPKASFSFLLVSICFALLSLAVFFAFFCIAFQTLSYSAEALIYFGIFNFYVIRFKIVLNY